ncbi:hypothetical protein GC163_06460 [bacterium]|nr:hypothetical protein [bacterium]
MSDSAPRQLRRLLDRPGILRTLAPHDVFTAKVCEQAGMELLFLGGFGVTASQLGLPDLSLLTMTEMADQVRRVAAVVSIPVIVDGDTGFGGPANIARTVSEFEAAGAAGMLIEDQVFPKRCGHFAGKAVVSTTEMLDRLQYVLEARHNPDFVIIARTDARSVEGLDAAIKRAQHYADAGADLIFVEAPESIEELRRIATEIRKPQLANMLVGGKTPILSASELEQMGFKICVSPVETLAATGHIVQRLAQAMLQDGRVDGLADDMWSFAELKAFLGVERS